MHTSLIARRISIIASAIVMMLIGCAPVLSDRFLQEANLSIAFQEILNDPNLYKGKFVVLGGRIITTTAKDEETWIEVLQQPLDRQYRPESSDVSYGRFLIILKGVVDPVIYASGRRITIAGEVTGKIVMPIQELPYTYPVISPRELVLIGPEYYYDSLPRLYYNAGKRNMQ
ncbi:MAG TPA: Slp family lipoprotein [Smithellaceae bacterium]|nr:Slp family lipoprotein [Smithellaceae bacterium]HPE07717.1 Slp family lipoprotein [Smithellaceae bacterium]HRY38722.1 Slp family lipoprotein [Smithellaceae bacterium]